MNNSAPVWCTCSVCYNPLFRSLSDLEANISTFSAVCCFLLKTSQLLHMLFVLSHLPVLPFMPVHGATLTQTPLLMALLSCSLCVGQALCRRG